MFPRKYWNIAVAFVLILAALVLISYNVGRDYSEAGLLRKLVLEAAWPLESLKNKIIKTVKDKWNRYLFLVGVEEENRRLKRENHLLQGLLSQYHEGHLEAIRLRKLLDIKKQHEQAPVVVEVIDREYSSVFRSILINKGTSHGLSVGLPVLSDQGIVGRITECSWRACRVMLISDFNSRVSVLLQQNRSHGILQGAGGAGCRLKYIPKTEEVKVGDPVISSGWGGIFPKGIILGIVTAADKKEGALFQRVDVRPTVDFEKLEEVYILMQQQ